jgi:hypothetical protein
VRKPSVAVLGGGLQGCCVALALAERGCAVVLFDRNDALLSRTAVANEGKIHLGYMYAGDPSLATARMMMQGALAFAPFIRRYIKNRENVLATSNPAAYVVHRDSQHDVEEVSAYLLRVYQILLDASKGHEDAYFGADLGTPPRAWSDQERDAAFNRDVAVKVFDSPEVAVNPAELASAIGSCVLAAPRIELRLNTYVHATRADPQGLQVTSEGQEGCSHDIFDHVVNALWDGRLEMDQSMGLKPNRPWLHRLKYGVSFTWPDGLERPPSATFVSGPFGEIVSYADRLTYLTWYPTCLQGISQDLRPPEWATFPPEPLRSQVLNGTVEALAEIVPCLTKIDPAQLPDAKVKGGVIVAWGKTDIYDPWSGLHNRYEIGVTSHGCYHSIDPGKLTMAPYFAEICAARITAA